MTITDEAAPMIGLYSALFAFQQDMPKVPKTKTARVTMKGGGAYSYTYADLAVIAEHATPILAKYDLFFVSTPVPGPHGYELIGHIIHAKTGQELTGSLPLFGTNAQDLGGSITYMRRYLLGCLTGIITDDDTDADHSPGEPARQQDPRRPQPKPLAPQQIEALREWASSGVAVDDVVISLYPELARHRDNLANVMSREQGDAALEALRERNG
jgi:hypothetical protein